MGAKDEEEEEERGQTVQSLSLVSLRQLLAVGMCSRYAEDTALFLKIEQPSIQENLAKSQKKKKVPQLSDKTFLLITHEPVSNRYLRRRTDQDFRIQTPEARMLCVTPGLASFMTKQQNEASNKPHDCLLSLYSCHLVIIKCCCTKQRALYILCGTANLWYHMLLPDSYPASRSLPAHVRAPLIKERAAFGSCEGHVALR